MLDFVGFAVLDFFLKGFRKNEKVGRCTRVLGEIQKKVSFFFLNIPYKAKFEKEPL
jgi:hypothetical protein